MTRRRRALGRPLALVAGLVLAVPASAVPAVPAVPEMSVMATVPAVAGGRDGTAAAAFGWGAPAWSDDFGGAALDPRWSVYDSPGHAGNGVRRPDQVAVAGGVMTQTGTAATASAGMVLAGRDERVGRWEVRARAAGDPGGRPYHAVVALLPVGVPYAAGERDVDIAEADVGSGEVSLFLHYPPNKQDYRTVPVDLAQWHTYGVEVTRSHVTWFVDGVARATDTHRPAIPTTPLAVNVQLDATAPTGHAPARLQVDWVRFHALPSPDVRAPVAPEPLRGDYDPGS